MANTNTLLILAAALAVGIIIIQNSNSGTDNETATGANMVSQAQLAQTEQLEGFRSMAYADGSSNGTQLYSIGYGHQLQPGESYPNGISQAQAQQLLLNDMQTVVDTLNSSGYSFTQGQFDALADFGYNAGVGALQSALNIYGNQGAGGVAAYLPTAYILWHPVPGGAAQTNQTNVTRRNIELNTWNSGTPIATAQATTTDTTDDSLQWFNSTPATDILAQL